MDFIKIDGFNSKRIQTFLLTKLLLKNETSAVLEL